MEAAVQIRMELSSKKETREEKEKDKQNGVASCECLYRLTPRLSLRHHVRNLPWYREPYS